MRRNRVALPDLRPDGRAIKTHFGFTLLELIAVLAVVVILTLLALPNASDFLRRAAEVRCAANMRSITIGLRAYLLDNQNIWPQGPTPEAGAVWESFWLSSLQP